jgi:hypothetical protein
MSSIFLDFRATSGYVTDPAGATYVVLEDLYPTTRAGVTFGWNTAPSGDADRDNTNIAQLAGINYVNNTTTAQFILEFGGLSGGGIGTYKIGLALGDATTNNGIQKAVVDDTVAPFTATGTMSAANKFIDATGVERSNTAWLTGQAYQTVTGTGGGVIVTIGGAASGFTCLSCLYAEFIPTATALPALIHRYQTFPRRRGR